jgi:hypothetical protein
VKGLDIGKTYLNCKGATSKTVLTRSDYGDEGRVYRVMCRGGIIEE